MAAMVVGCAEGVDMVYTGRDRTEHRKKWSVPPMAPVATRGSVRVPTLV